MPTAAPMDVPIDLLRRPSKGKAYDLSSGWWPGMPLATGHPPFLVMSFRTPRGERNQRDLAFLDENRVNFGFISELVMGTTHTGTHIDALAHITCGPESAWHGGHSADTELGDFGPMNSDASELPPIVAQGVLLDIPAALGVEALQANQPIGANELEAACQRQGTALSEGNVVLVRTGTMQFWPDVDAMAQCVDTGVSLDGARWLRSHEVRATGSDTAAYEVAPSGIQGDPQPVHRYLIQEQGLPILEWVFLEDLARDQIYEFLFLCVPLGIRGATGSLVRPLAIV
jgi:kynurenine formamidase